MGSQFYTYPPTFFSESEGILLNEIFSDTDKKLEPLVFMTTDKGESWIQLSKNIVNQNIKWTYSSGTNIDIVWSITYKDQIWQSKDGITWNVLH